MKFVVFFVSFIIGHLGVATKSSSAFEAQIAEHVVEVQEAIDLVLPKHSRELLISDGEPDSAGCGCAKDATLAVLKAEQDALEGTPLIFLSLLEVNKGSLSIGGEFEPKEGYVEAIKAIKHISWFATETLHSIDCGLCDVHDGSYPLADQDLDKFESPYPGITHYECCCDVRYIKDVAIAAMKAIVRARAAFLNPGASAFITLSLESLKMVIKGNILDFARPYAPDTRDVQGTITVCTGDVSNLVGTAACVGYTLHSVTGGQTVTSVLCGLPDANQEKDYNFTAPRQFCGGIGRIVLHATNRDGWYIKSLSTAVSDGPNQDFIMNIDGGVGFWVDGMPFDSDSAYSNRPHSSKWTIYPNQQPLLGETEGTITVTTGSINLADTDACVGYVLYSQTGSQTVTGSFCDIPGISFSKDYDFTAPGDFGIGGIGKIVLQAGSINGWYVGSLATIVRGGLLLSPNQDFDLDIDPGTPPGTGVWVDGRPFDSNAAYSNRPFHDTWTIFENQTPQKGQV